MRFDIPPTVCLCGLPLRARGYLPCRACGWNRWDWYPRNRAERARLYYRAFVVIALIVLLAKGVV